jgi:RHS repeat-associated protein
VRAGITTTAYLYNGDGALAQETTAGTSTAYWLDTTGGLPERLGATTGGSTSWYTRGWGQELSQEVGGTQTWYLADRLGSVRGLVNSPAGLTASYNYDPLGTPEGAAPGEYGFAGEPQNSTLGLVQLRARWYGTGPGRFLTHDPIAARPMDPFSVDAYQYGNGDPVNRTDATGLRVDDVTRAAESLTWSGQSNGGLRGPLTSQFYQPTSTPPSCQPRSLAPLLGLSYIYSIKATPAIQFDSQSMPMDQFLRGFGCQVFMWNMEEDHCFPIVALVLSLGELAPAALERVSGSIERDSGSADVLAGDAGRIAGAKQGGFIGPPSPATMPQGSSTQPGYRVLFGQARISANFSTKDNVPSYLAGRDIRDVEADLRAGRLTPDQMLVEAFTHPEDGQSLVAINNRGLGALSLAGRRPTNIRIRPPTLKEAKRLNDISVLGDNLPSTRIGVTPNQQDTRILFTIDIP